MSKYQVYADVREIAERPGDKKRVLPIGRGGRKIKPRKFSLTNDEIKDLKAEFAETKKMPNPFSMGSYHFIFAALLSLGTNSKHKLAEVYSTARGLMSAPSTKKLVGKVELTAWQRFRDKKSRVSKDKALDVLGRFEQNIRVLQRFGGMTPYGLKILQVSQRVCGNDGGVIDVLGSKDGEIYVSLNTKNKVPTNELKHVRAEKTTKVTPKAKPAKKRKATKRVAKPTTTATETPAETVATPETVTA